MRAARPVTRGGKGHGANKYVLAQRLDRNTARTWGLEAEVADRAKRPRTEPAVPSQPQPGAPASAPPVGSGGPGGACVTAALSPEGPCVPPGGTTRQDGSHGAPGSCCPRVSPGASVSHSTEQWPSVGTSANHTEGWGSCIWYSSSLLGQSLPRFADEEPTGSERPCDLRKAPKWEGRGRGSSSDR